MNLSLAAAKAWDLFLLDIEVFRIEAVPRGRMGVEDTKYRARTYLVLLIKSPTSNLGILIVKHRV
jgi:hypothetical protein